MILSFQIVLAIGLGGFLGAISRAYCVYFSNKYLPFDISIGVLLSNVIGSFIVGILFSYFSQVNVEDTTKAFLITGFLGALTTYSTFAIESYLLFGTSLYLAIINMVLNLFGSIIAAAAGFRLIEFFIK